MSIHERLKAILHAIKNKEDIFDDMEMRVGQGEHLYERIEIPIADLLKLLDAMREMK